MKTYATREEKITAMVEMLKTFDNAQRIYVFMMCARVDGIREAMEIIDKDERV